MIFIWILLVINSSLENSLYIRRYKAYHKSGHCLQAEAAERGSDISQKFRLKEGLLLTGVGDGVGG